MLWFCLLPDKDRKQLRMANQTGRKVCFPCYFSGVEKKMTCGAGLFSAASVFTTKMDYFK
jgi:hypothetical protein